jgi:hypothetical protein
LNVSACAKWRRILPHTMFRSASQSRFKDIGYVKEVLGALVATDDGLQRIALNKPLTGE